MPWTVELTASAERDFADLDHPVRRRVQRFIDERLLTRENPRELGEALTGRWTGYWRYRVGDIRLIATFEDERLVIVLVYIRHRREVYR
jgi:mRNA interferase RelE/StbE